LPLVANLREFAGKYCLSRPSLLKSAHCFLESLSMATPADLNRAIEQIRFARWYTSELLSDIPLDQWFQMPAVDSTHVAWQAGHLAFAQHALCIMRQRPERPEDEQLIPAAFRQLFGRNSLPSADPAAYPSAAEIRATFDRVHDHVLHEIADFDPASLNAPGLKPHRFCKTRLDSLFWCSQHELVHAGQIALLRRLLGKSPQW
jgi:hypothetical protein